MHRPVPIRRSLLVNLVLVLLLLSAGLIGMTIYTGRRVAMELSASIIQSALDETDSRLDEFFDPVAALLQLTPRWGAAGLLDLDEPDRLDALLGPVLDFAHISAFVMADSTGREYMLMRNDDGWLRRRIDLTRHPGEARVTEWMSSDTQPVDSVRSIDYDPRDRLWFIGAVERRHAVAPGTPSDTTVHWTEPYSFYESGEPGLTASVALPATGDGVDRVIAFDILLTDVTEFTLHLRPSPHGLAFVMTEQGRIIGLPRDPRFSDPATRQSAIFTSALEFIVPVVRDGTRAYFATPLEDREVFRFASEGTAWWGGCQEFPLGDDTLLLAVGVPSRDLIGGLRALRWLTVGAVLLVFAAAIWRARVLARRYSEPVEALVRESERISRGDLEPGPPLQSRVREVRRLSQAHEKMRGGLRTLLKLERDVQLARDIQQRTFPEQLPRLKGFEIGAWSDPADETGGDTYDVVGFKGDAITTDRAERALLLVADATGHGIGPAISATQVRAMLRMAARSSTAFDATVRQLNDQLCADLPEGRFVTAWLAQLDAAARTLLGFSAGQAPIVHYVAAEGVCRRTEADTVPLGVVTPLDVKLSAPVTLDKGDIVAVISDGIYEAMDPSGGQYGVDRVCALIEEHHGATPDRIIEKLREAVETHTQDAPAADDQTGILVKAV